jgi:hypothetical protein
MEVETVNWRAMFLSAALAAGLTLTFVPRATADPPPWASASRNAKHGDADHDRDDRGYWRHRQGDSDRDSRYGRYDRPYGGRDRDGDGNDAGRYGRYGRPYNGGYSGYRGNDPQYSKLINRMNYDRAKIAQNEQTGRHPKALQWYKDDLRNAQRDMSNYRHQGRS